jgi:elongation factor G
VISAYVPASELVRYAVDLRSMTGGRGRYVAEHHHHDVLPSHLLDKAKAAAVR